MANDRGPNGSRFGVLTSFHRSVMLFGSLLSVTIAASAGCGGKANKNAHGDGGSSDERPLDELGDDEIKAVCEGVRDSFERHIGADFERGACILFIGAEAESVEECEDLTREYCDLTSDASGEVDVSECIDDLATVEDCEVSVGDLDGCIDAQIHVFEVISDVTCDNVMELDTDSLSLERLPAECEVLSERCPELFEPEQDVDVEPGPGIDDPAGEPNAPSVSGDLDGEDLELPLETYAISIPGLERDWVTLNRNAADLRLWGDEESTQGLLTLPPGSSGGSNEGVTFVCLDDVELEQDGSGQLVGWNSANLSVLEECDWDGGQPLELDFDVFGSVDGQFGGEPVDWVNDGFSCADGCTFEFESEGTRVVLGLENLDGFVQDEAMSVLSSTLVLTGDTASVACGGGGTVLFTSDEHVSVRIDEFSPLESCPGDPVAGELRGTL